MLARACRIRSESKAFRPPRRRRSRPGRAPSIRLKRTPKPPFSPARRLPASTRSSAKPHAGPASGAGAWALRAAAANVRRACRAEDEAALRDAFHLSRPGGDPGPAGKFLLAWRELGRAPNPAVAVLVGRRRRGSAGWGRRSAGRGARGGRGPAPPPPGPRRSPPRALSPWLGAR